MEYVRLGKTGLKVSRLCLGTMTYGTAQWRPWVLEEADSRPFIKRALEHGINFFDTADMYSRGVSEKVLGRALKDFAPRDQVVIATKGFYAMGDGPNDRGLSRKHLLDAIDASLQRLGVDHVDLYQIHRFDPQTSIEETLEALHDIVRSGKARYIGASSWQNGAVSSRRRSRSPGCSPSPASRRRSSARRSYRISMTTSRRSTCGSRPRRSATWKNATNPIPCSGTRRRRRRRDLARV